MKRVGTVLALGLLVAACGRDAAAPRAPSPPAPREASAPGFLEVFECTSSCDAISAMWSTFHLGPIVGKQPMHGFTSVRRSIPVTAPDRRDMGKFSVALSWEGFVGQPALEGRPIALDWEAPESFETRKTCIDEAVAEATRRLATAK